MLPKCCPRWLSSETTAPLGSATRIRSRAQLVTRRYVAGLQSLAYDFDSHEVVVARPTYCALKP